MLSEESSGILQEWIPVDELGRNERVFCYPSMDKECINETKKELLLLGVRMVRFVGNSKVRGLQVLGKGKNSIVIEGLLDGRTVACKLLRYDSNRKDMGWEEEVLKKANSVSVGPKLLGSGSRVIVMERIYGRNLDEFLKSANKKEIKTMLSSLLDQTRSLDRANIRHKELANASKHVIVDGVKPVIIDFESVSLNCKGHNVAAICQYIFIRRMGKLLYLPIDELIEQIRIYRRKPTERNFRRLKKLIITNAVKSMNEHSAIS